MTQRYPAVITQAMLALANSRATYPRYDSTGSADWAGGVKGDDVSVSTANVTLACSSDTQLEADYTPRTQAAKATANAAITPPAGSTVMGVALAADVGRKRGAIAPNQRYPIAGDAAVAAPTLTSIAPNTGTAGGADVAVILTGTNFTPWSDVIVGGVAGPYRYMRYISATSIEVVMDCLRSTAGTATIAVTDHGVTTSSQTFTFS